LGYQRATRQPTTALCAAFLLTVLAVLLLAGCAFPLWHQGPPPNTGIVGRVTISGGPAPGMTRAYPQSRVEVYNEDGRLVASARSNADGSYRIALSPGRYRVTAVPTAGNPWFVPQMVVVGRGQFRLVELDAPVP
jgi:hypothetical protein